MVVAKCDKSRNYSNNMQETIAIGCNYWGKFRGRDRLLILPCERGMPPSRKMGKHTQFGVGDRSSIFGKWLWPMHGGENTVINMQRREKHTELTISGSRRWEIHLASYWTCIVSVLIIKKCCCKENRRKIVIFQNYLEFGCADWMEPGRPCTATCERKFHCTCAC